MSISNQKEQKYDDLKKVNPESYFPLGYYYSFPESTFCQHFNSTNNSTDNQHYVYFFKRPMNQNQNYQSFDNAYPSFQYVPCYYPNTSI
jgi:hypothetical protein